MGDEPEITQWLDRRRELGQDGFDEVWEGVYHVPPTVRSEHAQVTFEVLITLEARARAAGLRSAGPFNLGTGPSDFRVPDGGWFTESPNALYVPTATAVLEVLSPDDETFAKFDFYAARGVREILVAHPTERWVRCWTRDGGQFQEAEASAVFGVGLAQLATEIDWP